MPTSQKVQIDTFDFGASLTAPTLGALATGTTIANGTALTCNEQTVDSGVYIADFVGADPSALIPAGTYRLRTAVNGLPLKRFVTFTGVDGEVVYARSEEAAVLNTATQTQITAIETFAARVTTGIVQDGAVWQFTANMLELGPSGSGGGSGTGARTVTITVNDGATALQNATVRITEGANTFTALTNASGVAVFNLDDATYTVSITKSGYSYAGTTLVVNGTETATYSMTAISVTPPADPALCAVTIHVRDQYGIDAADVPVEITFVQWDDTATETPPVLSIPPVQTTDAGGLVQVNLYRLAVYKIIYGEARNARRWDGTIPDAGSYEVEL